jgi:hypothetical protein
MGGEPLETIVQNIQHSSDAAQGTSEAGTVTPAELNWVTCKEQGRIAMPRPEPLNFVIGSDLVYDDLTPEPLLWVLQQLCPPPPQAPAAGDTSDGTTGAAAAEASTGPEIIIAVDNRGRVGLKHFLYLASQHFEVTSTSEEELLRLTGIGAANSTGIVRMRRKRQVGATTNQ